MKKFALLCCALFSLSLRAQDIMRVTETFDDSSNRFELPEFSGRKSSAIISDGYYVLTRKSFMRPYKEIPIAKLPINVGRNFKLSFKFFFPKFDKKSLLLIKSEGVSFGVNLGMFFVNYMQTKNKPVLESLPIVLTKGKDKEVLIEVEKKGRNTNFYVNNMEVYTTSDMEFSDSNFEFMMFQGALKIDEITVEQQMEE